MDHHILFSLKPRSPSARQIVNYGANIHLIAERNGEQLLDIGSFQSAAVNDKPLCIATLGRAGDVVLPMEWTAVSRIHCAFLAREDNCGLIFVDTSSNASCQAYGGAENARELLSPGVREVDGSSYSLERIAIRVTQRDTAEFDIVWCYTPAKLPSALTDWRRARLPRHPRMADTQPWPEEDIHENARHAADHKAFRRLHTGDTSRFVIQGDPIGQGGFGTVFKAIHADSGKIIAVKVQSVQKSTQREISILKKLHHPNIVKFLGSTTNATETVVQLFMSLQDGSVESLVQMRDRPLKILDQKLAHAVFYDLLKALDYLHYKGLIHRDLKPANVLYVFRQGRLSFRLCDFGLSNWASDGRTLCGTMMFAAPEIHYRWEQTTAVDMWSLFMTVAWIADLCMFRSSKWDNYIDLLRWVIATAQLKWNHLAAVQSLIVINPTRRATAAQMLVLGFNGVGLTTPLASVPELPQAVLPVVTDLPEGMQSAQRPKPLANFPLLPRANANRAPLGGPLLPKANRPYPKALPAKLPQKKTPILRAAGPEDRENTLHMRNGGKSIKRYDGGGEPPATKTVATSTLRGRGRRASVPNGVRKLSLKRPALGNEDWLKRMAKMPGAFPEHS